MNPSALAFQKALPKMIYNIYFGIRHEPKKHKAPTDGAAFAKNVETDNGIHSTLPSQDEADANWEAGR